MTTVYTVTRNQIISSALRKLGVLELGDTPDSDTIANASLVLNLMIKMWAIDGLKLWTIDELTLPLVAAQTSYTIGPSGCDLTASKPLKLIQAWLRNTTVTPNVDTPLQILSQQEYNLLGSKSSTGTANSVYLDPRVNSSTLYTYLTPETSTAATYQMHLVVQRMMSDVTTDITPDFPTEWMQCLVWNLADQLAIEYTVPQNHRVEIAMKAASYKDQMTGWDVESVSTFFIPDMRFGNNNAYR